MADDSPTRRRGSILPSWRWPRSGKQRAPSSPSKGSSNRRFFCWSSAKPSSSSASSSHAPPMSLQSDGRSEVVDDCLRCPICIEPLPANGGVAFGCPHELCNGCLWRWINEDRFVGEDSQTCPICRTHFRDDIAFCSFVQALDERISPLESLPLLDECVSLVPRFAAAHAMRGNFLDHLGRAEEAAEACKRALALHPADEFSPVFLLSAFRAQGFPDGAVHPLTAALAKAPANRSAELCIGRALLLSQRYEEAEAALRLLAGRAPLHGHDDASFAAWLFLYEYYSEITYNEALAQEAADGATDAFEKLSFECQMARHNALTNVTTRYE